MSRRNRSGQFSGAVDVYAQLFVSAAAQDLIRRKDATYIGRGGESVIRAVDLNAIASPIATPPPSDGVLRGRRLLSYGGDGGLQQVLFSSPGGHQVSRLREGDLLAFAWKEGDLGDSPEQHVTALGFEAPQLAPGTVAETFGQLVLTMHYLHGRNIVHRDLKPANILYDEASRRLDLDGGDDASKTFVEIADLDQMIRVDKNGHISDDAFVFATPSYLPPSLRRILTSGAAAESAAAADNSEGTRVVNSDDNTCIVLGDDTRIVAGSGPGGLSGVLEEQNLRDFQDAVRQWDHRRLDLYALGLTLRELYRPLYLYTYNVKGLTDETKITEEQVNTLYAQVQGDPRIVDLIDRLLEHGNPDVNAGNLITLEQIMESELFGVDAAEREVFFERMQEMQKKKREEEAAESIVPEAVRAVESAAREYESSPTAENLSSMVEATYVVRCDSRLRHYHEASIELCHTVQQDKVTVPNDSTKKLDYFYSRQNLHDLVDAYDVLIQTDPGENVRSAAQLELAKRIGVLDAEDTLKDLARVSSSIFDNDTHRFTGQLVLRDELRLKVQYKLCEKLLSQLNASENKLLTTEVDFDLSRRRFGIFCCKVSVTVCDYLSVRLLKKNDAKALTKLRGILRLIGDKPGFTQEDLEPLLKGHRDAWRFKSTQTRGSELLAAVAAAAA